MRHISSLYNIKGTNSYVDLREIVFISSVFNKHKGNGYYSYYFTVKCKGTDTIKITNEKKEPIIIQKDELLRNWKRFK